MKQNTLFVFVQLLLLINPGSSADSESFFRSPSGPYKLFLKQVYNCNPTSDNKIQYNMYLSHRANSTWLFGNTTIKIPLDDSFFLEISLSFKDSFGNWKENVFNQKSPKACSALKKIMGKTWTTFVHGYGIPSTECPILPGVYISPGIDPLMFEKSNFPQSFFYGKYKVHMFYSKSNEIFGCQAYIIELKRR